MPAVYAIYLESPATMCNPERITFDSTIEVDDPFFAALDNLSSIRGTDLYPTELVDFLREYPEWEQEFPGALVSLLDAPSGYRLLSDHLNCEGFIVFRCADAPAAIMRTGWHLSLKPGQLIKG